MTRPASPARSSDHDSDDDSDEEPDDDSAEEPDVDSAEESWWRRLRGRLATMHANGTGPAPVRSGRLQEMMQGQVLVLNSNYEPLNVCDLRRAFRLVFGAKAEVLEYDHQVVRSARDEHRAPSVIRVQHLVRRPRPRVKLTRREILARDAHTCQYCGHQGHDLTVDHVVPRHRGGEHTWDNVVTACRSCNHRKGGKLAEEAHLRLLRPAVEPRCDVYALFTPYLAESRNEPWRSYLFLGRA